VAVVLVQTRRTRRRSRWELTGEVERVRSSFVNGIHHMPVVLDR
jgi:hypothetical protein